MMPAGDMLLRHDVRLLADYGVIRGTTSSWPLAWGPVLGDLGDADLAGLPQSVADAAQRVRRRAAWETRINELTFDAKAGIADNGTRIRTFQNTPRGKAEISAGLNWTGARIAADLNVQAVESDSDSDEFRADESYLGIALGNWTVGASTQSRWWGPGWDGSIILSNNARPIPSLVIDRISTDAFESEWLSWLGPWDLTVMFGELESERAVPNARLFGLRFAFRPLPSLEFGLSRTAQWCGDGRPCDFETFTDLLLGRDNRGDAGIGEPNEPGNQLAGLDWRWAPAVLGSRISLYGQFIGEDEAGGLPSRYLGLVGADWSGYLVDRWSVRAFAEFAGTSCQFYESSKRYNCAYNHGIYTTGYRYRGRSIGHGADNDAQLVSLGAILADVDETQWRAVIRTGELNRGGSPDPRNTLTPTPQDIWSVDVAHSRAFNFGVVEAGIGYESVDDLQSGTSRDDTRLYLQWRSSY